MKRSNILFGIVFVLFVVVVIAGFTVPQPVLDENVMYLFLIVAVMGWMWLQAFVDASKGK